MSLREAQQPLAPMLMLMMMIWRVERKNRD